MATYRFRVKYEHVPRSLWRDIVVGANLRQHTSTPVDSSEQCTGVNTGAGAHSFTLFIHLDHDQVHSHNRQ